MKYIFVLILGISVHSKASVIISAEDDWAPWSSGDKHGEAVGRSVDYLRKIFKSFNVTAQFKSVPFSRCLKEAREGKTLGCFHTAKTIRFAEDFDFPEVPLVEDEVLIYTTSAITNGASQLADLKGQKVGVTSSYSYSPEFDSMNEIHREESKEDLQTFRKLVGGRVSYIALFKGAAESLLLTHPDLNIKGLRTFPAGKAQFYLAFSKKYPNSKRYLKRYNQSTKNFPTLRMHPLSVKVYGDRAYPPYSFVNASGDPAGIYVDLLKSVFDEMKDDFQVTFEMVPWSRGLQLLKAGSGFALFPPYKIPARTYIDEYSEAINIEKVIFYCNSSSLSGKVEFPKSFKGFKIGVTQDFVLDSRLAQQFNDGTMTRVDVMDNSSGLIQLANHNVDCYINDALSVEWAFAEMKKENHPVLQKFPAFTPQATYVLVEQPAYLAFSIHTPYFPHKEKFIKRFNTILKKNLSAGQLSLIKGRYLPGSTN